MRCIAWLAHDWLTSIGVPGTIVDAVQFWLITGGILAVVAWMLVVLADPDRRGLTWFLTALVVVTVGMGFIWIAGTTMGCPANPSPR